MRAKPRIGVSACLLGKPVRYNGDHKRNEWITEKLARHAHLVGTCPEVEMGLGVPRPALRLAAGPEGARLVESGSGADLTAKAEAKYAALARQAADLDGFILKKDSPSCGIERVKVYGKSGIPSRIGTGLFAAKLQKRHPLLPTIEEGRLTDPAQRESFVLRVFAFQEARELLSRGDELTMRSVQNFHRRYKLILLEHSPKLYASLGALVGKAGKERAASVMSEYLPVFMSALGTLPSVGNRVNVLQHAYGYLRGVAGSRERAQILEAILDYQKGELPFIAPLTLVFHEIRKFGVTYLLEQKFFAPFPRELAGHARL